LSSCDVPDLSRNVRKQQIKRRKKRVLKRTQYIALYDPTEEAVVPLTSQSLKPVDMLWGESFCRKKVIKEITDQYRQITKASQNEIQKRR